MTWAMATSSVSNPERGKNSDSGGGRLGERGNDFQRCSFGLLGVHADSLWFVDRALQLAHPFAEWGGAGVQTLFDCGRPADGGEFF